MGKVIGILNQKGGVGKSTLTTLLATNLYIGSNKKRDNNFVAVFDGDIPQYTIKNIRTTEKKFLSDRIENENDYYIKKYKSIYHDNFEPLKIYSGSIETIYNDFDSLRNNHEYTFIDIVGTLNVAGYDHKFLSNFDLIIIPMNLDYEVLRSTLNFIKNLIHPLHKSGKLNYAIVLNNIDGREKKGALATQEQIRSINYPVLDNIIYRKKKYVSLFLDGSRGMLSTIYDSFDITLNKLLEEIKEKL